MTRRVEAEEHAARIAEPRRDEKLDCIPPNGAGSGPNITRTFRLPATPPVHVPARRLTS